MRKQRRKIQRKKRKRNKSKKKSRLARHLDSIPTNRWTKITTYILIVLEVSFVMWFLQDMLLNWQEILVKLKNIVSIITGWFI